MYVRWGKDAIYKYWIYTHQGCLAIIVLLWGWKKKKKKRNRSKTTSSVFRSFFFSFVIGATQLHHKSPDSRGWQHHGGPVEKLSKQPDRTKLHDKQRCHVEFLPLPENAQRWRTSEQTAAYQCAVTHRPPQSLAAVLFAGREATLTTRIIFTFHICKEKTEFHLLIQVWNNNLGKLEMWFFFFFNWTIRFCFKGPILCKFTSPHRQRSASPCCQRTY